MNSKNGFNRLDRRTGHRKALIKNLLTSLFQHERIITTKSKALELRRAAEKMVTRAREDSLHNRREIAKVITNEDILRRLFTEIGPRFKERPGGYTRVLKLGFRSGDAAEMALIEFVDRKPTDEVAEAPVEKKKAEKTKAKGAVAKA